MTIINNREIESKARELATFVLENLKPDEANSNYKYLESIINRNGMTFYPKNNEKLPFITEIQLTKRTRFFKTDLEVYLIVKGEGKRIIEVLDFNNLLFDRVFYQYFIDKKQENMDFENKKNATFIKAMNNVLE
jgi:hypothetical protein